MYVILPFEVDFYQKFDYQVKFIGNPVQDSVNLHRLNADFVEQNRLPENKPLIALLPGSRTQELASMLPLMREVAKKYPHYHFVVAAIKTVEKVMYDPVKYLGNVSLVYEQTYDLLAFADAAVVTSGTATLETALFDVPQVVVYRTNAFSYAIGRWLVKVDFISLVNLIAGREVIQEFLQGQMSVENVAAELEKLVEDKSYRARIMKGYQEMKEKLGDRNASQEAARLMFRDLKSELAPNRSLQ
jgi:lipid-A-disaccharide synthase